MSFFVENIISQLQNNQDVMTRQITCKGGVVELIFLKSMSDKNEISEQIISPIMRQNGEFTFEELKGKIISSSEIEEIDVLDIVKNILQNKIVVIYANKALAIDLEFFPARLPSEPPTSPNIYGPREGFVESIKTNMSLIRKRLPTQNLTILQFEVGEETKSKVCMFYIKNIANKKVVKEIADKIKKIKLNGVIDSYYIAEFLKKKPYSMFEQCGFQEKPDIVVAKMLEGRVAILVDGSPIAITLPYMVFEDFQSSNDYYTNYAYVNLIRIIRTIGVIIATVIPGLYLSIRLYSYKVLPLNYVITIANSTKNLPFTPVLEIIFILLLFQILYEVSLRLPQYLGLATSIVGALVLGDTGVKAGLISPPGVIIVAVSIMAIYTVPSQSAILTVLRAIFVILGATVGIFGIVGGVIYFVNYINTLNYYETPYLAPYAPKIKTDLKDGLFKKPLSAMKGSIRSIPQTKQSQRREKQNGQ